ncbi:MAG: hypothetical protein GY705_22405 [Bacteroidetes bacterium]|nr:hypothetical protein [Bacteroidota bacterium]
MIPQSDGVFHTVTSEQSKVGRNVLGRKGTEKVVPGKKVSKVVPKVVVDNEEEQDTRIVIVDSDRELCRENSVCGTAVPFVDQSAVNNLVENSNVAFNSEKHVKGKNDSVVDNILPQSSNQHKIDSKYVLVRNNKQKSIPQIYSSAFDTNPSPIKFFPLQAWLDGYDPLLKAQLLRNIQHGVSIPCLRPTNTQKSVPKNQPSALKNFKLVDEYIQEELSNKRICGPFDERPEGLFLSPLAAVPKKDSEKPRIIHNLSFPSLDSINDFIPRAFLFHRVRDYR